MGTNPIHALREHGQSVWLDQLSRRLLRSGELAVLVERSEVAGVTSNPTIFDKAISGSDDYDEQIRQVLAEEPGIGAEALYERLAVADVREAADLLRPLWEHTGHADGYVSLEVSPRLADETDTTVEEVHRLREEVGRPNVLIKVPATQAGVPAIARLIGEGVSINVTLIFARQVYADVVDAYMEGLERLAAHGGDPADVASVASFFVSRIDVAVDDMLPEGSPLRGKTSIANTRLAYATFRELFASDRFARLRDAGARAQRFLCASTSTKNPDYPDTLYVDELIGPDTVNTLPPATLEAFRDHGSVRETITDGLDEARAHMAALAEAGVDLDAVCAALTRQGVEKFVASYDALLAGLQEKRDALLADR